MFELLSDAGAIAAALIAPPGGELIRVLAAIDPAGVSDSAQVDLLVAWERQSAWVASRQQPALVAVAATAIASGWDQPCEDSGSGRGEIGAALRITPIAAALRLTVAEELCGRLAAVQAALAAGEISYWHAKAIAESTEQLADDKAVAVAAKVLPKAPRQSVAELKRALRRAVLSADPKSAEQRAARAHAERSMDWWPLADGMAEMRVITSAADVMAMVNVVDALARQDFGSPRDGSRVPIATRRADALVHLVTTERAAGGTDVGSGSVRRPQANVHLTMDLPTALGLADHPSELADYGPIDAATAWALAADGKWRRLICEPLTGALLDLGHTTYQPSAALTRYIQLRDVRCQFPSCNQPARRGHLDHTRKYQPDDPAGGRTDRNNLGALCEHHHQLKHRAGWTLRRDPDTEEATWTSPTGHRYPIDHEDHRTWDHNLRSYPADAFEGDASWNDLEAPAVDPIPSDPIPVTKGAVIAA